MTQVAGLIVSFVFRLRPEGAAAGLYKPVRFFFFSFFFFFSVKGFFIKAPQQKHLEARIFQGTFWGPIVTSMQNFVPKGRLGMVPGPPKCAKMACLGQFFTVAPPPDDLGSLNLLERFCGPIVSSEPNF